MPAVIRARPALVVAAGIERVPGEVEVVLVAAARSAAVGPIFTRSVGFHGPRSATVSLAEERVDVDRLVRLAGPALVGLLDEADDRGVPLGERLLVAQVGCGRRRNAERGRERCLDAEHDPRRCLHRAILTRRRARPP